LFNKLYHSSTGFERVKYGVLNILNDPTGVKCCAQYGDSYLLLKNVRLRTTFAPKDSGYADVTKLAMCEAYAHVLLEFDEQELKDLVSVANGHKFFSGSSVIPVGKYKEVQIHGELRFNRDVEAIVVNSRHKSDSRMLELISQFSTQNYCDVIWME